MNRTKAIFAIAVTLMSTAGISAPAFAGDNKVYAGGACMSQRHPVPTGVIQGSSFTNFSSQTVRVHCPVVRDQTGSAEGGGPDAFIDVSSPTVKCSLVTTRLVGGPYGSKTATPFLFFHDNAFDVFRYDIRDVPQIDRGAYYIDCTLPSGTSIFRYSVAE
ncbi:MAG: hypothetical protein KME17_22510 [Cyanosarcina radialis HA8281-LM2]|jgi:hypothetical protein|nr:hypothetical protein [Cyanosarcina radialis HA8281-LM2]